MISIIVPIYNEEENIVNLYTDIENALIYYEHEIIFVDDGSIDNSYNIISCLAEKDYCVKIIKLKKNYGQSAATKAGVDNSQGEIIVTLDGDLQNDPADIPKMLNKLNEGYDVVCGWRYNRKDKFFKKLLSKISNCLHRKMTGLKIHDSGCSLRVYRREVFDDIDLYGEMHRFLPAMIFNEGYRVVEMETNHRQRVYGKSKYGLGRIL